MDRCRLVSGETDSRNVNKQNFAVRNTVLGYYSNPRSTEAPSSSRTQISYSVGDIHMIRYTYRLVLKDTTGTQGVTGS